MTDRPLHTILFNDDRYQRCNMMPGQRLFRHDHINEGRLVGTLSGVVVNGLMDCGHSAPFGGVDLVKSREQLGIIVGLLRNALARARAEAVRDIRIRARPGYFGENEPAVEFALLNLGATIESCELSLGLKIWRYRTPEDYLASLSALRLAIWFAKGYALVWRSIQQRAQPNGRPVSSCWPRQSAAVVSRLNFRWIT